MTRRTELTHHARRVRGVLLLLLLAAAGWGVVRWLSPPELKPTVRRLILTGNNTILSYTFTAGGMGVPRMETYIVNTNAYPFTVKNRWVDDSGQPRRIIGADKAWVTCLSADGTLAAGVDDIFNGRKPCLLDAGGMRKLNVTYPKRRVTSRFIVPPNMFTITYTAGNGADYLLTAYDNATYRHDGSPIEKMVASRVAVMSPDYMALTNTTGDLFLYDRTARKRLLKIPAFLTATPMPSSYYGASTYAGTPGIVFAEGRRLLAVSPQGQARVFENFRRKGGIGLPTTRWCWAEDGTVWTVTGKKLQVLSWRSSTPVLRTLPIRVAHEARISGFTQVPIFAPPSTGAGPTDACVAQDGALVAVVDTVRLVPERLAVMAERVAGWVKMRKSIARDGRRLRLYRNGKLVGVFVARAKFPVGKTAAPTASPWSTIYSTRYREHLAFSRDGRTLSWLTDAGFGGVQMYAFPVPGK